MSSISIGGNPSLSSLSSSGMRPLAAAPPRSAFYAPGQRHDAAGLLAGAAPSQTQDTIATDAPTQSWCEAEKSSRNALHHATLLLGDVALVEGLLAAAREGNAERYRELGVAIDRQLSQRGVARPDAVRTLRDVAAAARCLTRLARVRKHAVATATPGPPPRPVLESKEVARSITTRVRTLRPISELPPPGRPPNALLKDFYDRNGVLIDSADYNYSVVDARTGGVVLSSQERPTFFNPGTLPRGLGLVRGATWRSNQSRLRKGYLPRPRVTRTLYRVNGA